jgi:hypothetical protein
MNRLRIKAHLLIGCLVALVGSVDAQEPTFMKAATHPATGQLYARSVFSHTELKTSQGESTHAQLKLAYGLKPTLAVVVESEWADINAGAQSESGISQSSIQLKMLAFKRDLGPLNTWRTSLFGGVTVPGDMDAYSPESSFPQATIASTMILHRHGLNLELGWKEYGNNPDQFEFNASHLYRLIPAEYAITTTGAWYSMLESLNVMNDQDDFRSDLAIGILYEARRWAWEFSARLPIEQDGPEKNDYTLAMGLRYLP